MTKESYIEEGINGQWTDWKFEAENNKRIYEELQRRIDKAVEYIKDTYDDVVTNFTEDKPMTNFKARKELLKILKGENYDNN